MFEIKTATDFYRMLVEDFDAFMDAPESGRLAIHCAITANHMREWVWHDWLKNDDATKAAISIADKKSFYWWVDSCCVWNIYLRAIANGSKHFERPEVGTSKVTGYGSGPYGVGPYGKGYLLVDLGGPDLLEEDVADGPTDDFEEPDFTPDQRFMPAAHLLEVVVRFWRDFHARFRPEPPVVPSKHHAEL